ncbi:MULTISPECIES: sialate O-acetylesterase [unclassified Sphingomonas]|uniref:sialate O-acetylesterase n=1 Tax=unclassified Sphingomonas TaxID=196159 RepID=UPI002861CF86|nr:MULTISPECIES: sialate O-acetylesterase [unclassified Sphingomonas]MDR6114460.1 sialate O-acetylesterase [Sphingomonas sp. SORGH_AS_0789]MDR6148181.1 sialate O-acetylesterase [Sphingomonas sp. SORGH_AS_0742]
MTMREGQSRSGAGRRAILALALGAAIAWPVMAEARPRILTPMSAHAVLQRDRPIIVEGTADAGERVKVTLGGNSADATADRQGRWRATLPAMAAGGAALTLTATGQDGATDAMDDLLIGDVWLCSGQSNMEYPTKQALNGEMLVKGAADDRIRLLDIAHHVGLSPEEALEKRPVWAAAAPASVADFSAACYLMVKDLAAKSRVPMGAIDSSWGGTKIIPWIPGIDARKLPGLAADVDLLALYARDHAAGLRAFGGRWGEWWRKASGTRAGQEPWNAPDRLNWTPVPKFSPWEDWGVPALADYNGLVWFRQGFDLAQAPTGDGVVELAGIDEMDTVWVNGVVVGATFGWGDWRRYTVPRAALRKGRNEIVVGLGDGYGPGGMFGPADRIRFTPAGGAPIPLGTGWRYSVYKRDDQSYPRSPWESHAGIGTLYNGMIAPLGPIGLKGVAWYQGESDVGRADYGDRLALLMAGWRRQFGDPALPFLIVQLANYGAPPVRIEDSGWAALRETQRLAVLRDPHSALATTVDIGVRNDIHPADKNELAKRLVFAQTHLEAGDRANASGPMIASATRGQSEVVLRFTGVQGALHAWSAAAPIGFELCGATACRYANATVNGSEVRLADARPGDVRVRYAWADAPVVNLYDEAPHPVVPFEAVITDQ